MLKNPKNKFLYPIISVLYMNKLLKHALCISSWFYLPEQGMKTYELLSRSSCFLIPQITNTFKKKFHVASCAHVTHPYLYKKYYKEDWLNFINENNVKTQLVKN